MKSRRHNGFTMIEILIVMAVVAVLSVALIIGVPRQMEKARDSRRKSDLKKIGIAFEHFYSDNNCYPSAIVLENCGGTSPADHELSSYLQDIPCDPQGGEYFYAPYDSSGGAQTCDGYRVWAALENETDPIISSLGCDGVAGCGVPGLPEYNYGISVGVPVFIDGS